MLNSLKRLFGLHHVERDLTEVSDWAQRRGMTFKLARREGGFVIDGQLEGKPWRIEWGETHRPYIHGHELRLRMSLDLPSSMQMLLMSRQLMTSLERQTFEDFTDNSRTQLGTKTPEEMRWLVMFPKVDVAAANLSKARFGAVAMVPEAGLAWITGALANMLIDAAHGFLHDDPPFVLMTLRGRAYLRMQLANPNSKDIAAALAVFETAVTQALRTCEGVKDKDRGPDWRPTSSTAWQSLPTDGALGPDSLAGGLPETKPR